MAQTDRIYRGGSCELDSPSVHFTGAVDLDGAITADGAASFTGGIYVNGSVAVSTGTTPTWPAAAIAFYGSQNNQALVLPNAASYQGRIIYVTTAGTGTITLTGYGSQTWNGNGTGTITPNKYALLISDGDNWRGLITSL